MGLAWIYREYDFPDEIAGVVRNITLQFVPHPYRELIILLVGIPALYLALQRLTQSLLDPLIASAP